MVYNLNFYHLKFTTHIAKKAFSKSTTWIAVKKVTNSWMHWMSEHRLFGLNWEWPHVYFQKLNFRPTAMKIHIVSNGGISTASSKSFYCKNYRLHQFNHVETISWSMYYTFQQWQRVKDLSINLFSYNVLCFFSYWNHFKAIQIRSSLKVLKQAKWKFSIISYFY